jgi:ParB family chromosome partitioning protein
LIRLAQIRVNGNYRRTFNPEKPEELTASIRAKGVLQPILVRQIAEDTFEVVAGGHRFRAAQLAEIPDIPARVVQLGDDELLEFQLIENAVREDVHPYDEAIAYKELLDRPGYDVPSIALKVGKSISHLYQRLALTNLIQEAAEAFQENLITTGHAVLIARLPEEQQTAALKNTFRENWQTKMKHAVPVRELAQWIRENLMLDLADSPSDKEDASLFPEAGSCATCPKRTGFNTALWDEFKEDRCLDAQCHAQKIKLHIARQIEVNPQLIRISAHYYSGENGTLARDRYTSVEPPKDGTEPTRSDQTICKHAKQAIVVESGKLGSPVNICSDGQCKIHRARTNRSTPDQQRQADDHQKQWLQEKKERDNIAKHNRRLFEAVVFLSDNKGRRAQLQTFQEHLLPAP